MEITSLNNIKVKNWLKLKQKKYRDLNKCFLIEGEHLLNEALKQNLVKEIIALDPTYEIKNIPFYLVNPSIMKNLSEQVSISPVIAVCSFLPTKNIIGNVLILDNIQDPGNLGTIIRSSIAFNINTIIMSNDTVDLYNSKVIRATEGMLFHQNFLKADLENIINQLKNKGYKIYATHVQKGKDLKKLDFSSKNAIIIGNEGQGVSSKILALSDELINIKINSQCESLNAAIAASIIMYEMSD